VNFPGWGGDSVALAIVDEKIAPKSEQADPVIISRSKKLNNISVFTIILIY